MGAFRGRGCVRAGIDTKSKGDNVFVDVWSACQNSCGWSPPLLQHQILLLFPLLLISSSTRPLPPSNLRPLLRCLGLAVARVRRPVQRKGCLCMCMGVCVRERGFKGCEKHYL